MEARTLTFAMRRELTKEGPLSEHECACVCDTHTYTEREKRRAFGGIE